MDSLQISLIGVQDERAEEADDLQERVDVGVFKSRVSK
jgi:hypothetical protein